MIFGVIVILDIMVKCVNMKVFVCIICVGIMVFVRKIKMNLFVSVF